MTSTIWTFGGGAAAADTFLLPHPPDDRRVKTTKPKPHSVVAKFRRSLEPLLLLAGPSFVKGLTRELDGCHRLRMASPSRLWTWYSSALMQTGSTGSARRTTRTDFLSGSFYTPKQLVCQSAAGEELAHRRIGAKDCASSRTRMVHSLVEALCGHLVWASG